MKIQGRRRLKTSKRGFTLVELLVVITIIVILITIGSFGLQGALVSAKRAKASALINQIQLGITNYQVDYGYYPVPTSAGDNNDFQFGSDDGSLESGWDNLTITLNGNRGPNSGKKVNSPRIPNPREQAYAQFKPDDCNDDILIQPMRSAKTGKVQYFTTWIDWDGDNVVEDLPNTKTKNEIIPYVTTSVATYATNDGVTADGTDFQKYRSSY